MARQVSTAPFASSDSESTALGPVASTSPGNLLELKTLESPPETHGLRNLEAGYVLMSPGGDSDTGYRV